MTSCWRCAAAPCVITFVKTAACRSNPLLAGVPISLRDAGNTEYTTQATMVRVGLASNITDPVKRLLAIRNATAAVKSTTGRTKGTQTLDFPSIGTPWLLHGLATIFGEMKLANLIPPFANLVISNVPGPTVPLYFAGARITHYWPLSIVQHGLGVNITVESYDGALGFGITAASSAVPDPRLIADALRVSLKELQRHRKPSGARQRKSRRREPPPRSTDERRAEPDHFRV